MKMPAITQLATCICLGLYSGNYAFAVCNTYTPNNGELVECTSTTPNSDNTPIEAEDGVSGVIVNIEPGSIFTVNGFAVSLSDNSQITNSGVLNGVTVGILFTGANNTVINNGDVQGGSDPGVLFKGGGTNTLVNSGTISSTGSEDAVVFGPDDDSFTMLAGTITGNVIQDDGADHAEITGGQIAGTLSQGAGDDDFFMSNGSLETLQQGDNNDTFTMTGGTISGAFEGGHEASMSGGSIGLVDMNSGDNTFTMSGGEILGDLTTGSGNDDVIISGTGMVGGGINVGNGNNTISVLNGNIIGQITMGSGDDVFHWEDGTMESAVLMGEGNDKIEFNNLNLGSGETAPLIDGGTGSDTLTMTNSLYQFSTSNLLQGIENVVINNNSVLTLKNAILALGDLQNDQSGTGYSLDSSGKLNIENDNAVAFNSHLSGTGTVSTNTNGNSFSFTTNNAGDNFNGTLALGNSAFNLTGLNTQALSMAMLALGIDSVTTVGDGTQNIGGLSFNGGEIDFGTVSPGGDVASTSIQTLNSLDLSGTGFVKVDIGNAENTSPGTNDNLPLLQQDDDNSVIKLASSQGSVIGDAGGLTLVDSTGNIISDSVTRNITQNGTVVAQGKWDWGLTSSLAQDGLYVGYNLEEVILEGQADNSLVLNSGNSKGNAADLSSRVTGTGDLAVESSVNGLVSLSNQNNDYTGVTDIRSGTLQMNNSGVLGKTSLLNQSAGTTLSMNGFKQTIGSIQTSQGAQTNLQGGELTINQGGDVAGLLSGAGLITLNGGILNITSDNSDLTASVNVAQAATVNLDEVGGLGSGDINHSGVLNLNSVTGDFINNLGNSGVVNLNESNVSITGDNTQFSGIFNIDKNSVLSMRNALNAGDSIIHDEGTLLIDNENDWLFDNAVSGAGGVTKSGAGTLTLTAANTGYTGLTEVQNGQLVFGSRLVPLTLASSMVNIESGVVAGNGVIEGNVNNNGVLKVGTDSQELSAVTMLAAASAPTNDELTIRGNLINNGLIQLGQEGGNSNPGNKLTVSKNYQGNGGRIVFNTVLGGDNSHTDKLIVEGNTGGTTRVSVQNAGGGGAKTLNGIELINVTGASNGDFAQDGRIVAGAYDYKLVRGENTNQKNWYLTSQTNQPGTTGGNSGNQSLTRPEAGSYISNISAANTMFTTRMNDRFYITQNASIPDGEENDNNLWLRQTGTHTGWRSDTGGLKTTSNQYIAVLGGDVAQWSSNGNDRGHVGLMAGYGNNHSNTISSATGNRSKGIVDGYSVGVYGTWFANEKDNTGLYLDSWAMYSWFDNTINGDGLSEENYKSQGVTASVETGYTWKAGEFLGSKGTVNTVYLQPQAQLTTMNVKADDHIEQNGTHVSSNGDGNIQSRLGARLFLKSKSALDRGNNREFAPYIEANWIHNSREFSTVMNDVTINEAGAKNIAEIKTGVEGRLTSNLTTWVNVGQQIGDKGYHKTEAVLGIKYSW